MKKNKMLRIASILLVVTLLSTCVISGTFAKYVTKAEGTDTARVAKWGVLLTLNAGNTFDTKYKTHDTSYDGELSVESSNGDKVVAPGTSAADIDAEIKASVSGTPEVATRYAITIEDIQDIVLPAGDHIDYTVLNPTTGADGKITYAYDGTFTTTEDYSPLKWTLKMGNNSLATGKSLTDVIDQMDKIKGKIEANIPGVTNVQVNVDKNAGKIEISFDAAPNTPIAGEFTLTWEWPFESGHDKEDTLLGNIIAGVADPSETATTTVSAKVTASATQID